jgi:broad specificity phosphatase PhoE
LETTIFLIRHGETEWHREGRLLGNRDLGLNADGINQSHAIVKALSGLSVSEVLTSPLRRAAQTAEIIGGAFDLEIARDPRLSDVRVGRWEGMRYSELAADPDFQRFMRNPLSVPSPGGEHVDDVRERAVASIGQALSDNPGGENIVFVTHANVIRIVLSHYLGTTLANFHLLRVRHGSISLLRFASDRQLPRVLALNYLPGGMAHIVS